MDSYKQYQNIQIEEVCRICLVKKDKMNFISEAGLEDMLLECASIQLTTDDGPYNLVCSQCANEISRWYVFKQRVHRSFEIGRWLIKQIPFKIDTIPIVSHDLYREEIALSDLDDPKEDLHFNRVEIMPSDHKVAEIVPASLLVEDSINKLEESQKPKGLIRKAKFKATCYGDVDNNDCEVERVSKSEKKSEEVDEDSKAIDTSGCIADGIDWEGKKSEKYTCDICERTCPTANALMKHKRVHRKTKDYICTKCGKAFKQSQTLADHMKKHYNLPKCECNICGQRFYKQYNLNMHLRTHTGEKPYKCPHCEGRAFTRPLLLRNHIKQVHTNDKKFSCSECGKNFIDSWQLKIHVRTHTGEKPHKCPHCPMAFAVSSSLHSHVRYKHTFEKKFVCSICSKAFTAKYTLDDHMRTHTGQKKEPRHECPTCGKKCDTTSTLKYHVRAAHTHDKPFACEMCEKRFLRRQHLVTHMRKHTGERPYVCGDCGKSFSASSSFSIHRRIHTGIKPFVCSVCGQAFIQSGGLRQHMRTHTNISANAQANTQNCTENRGS